MMGPTTLGIYTISLIVINILVWTKIMKKIPKPIKVVDQKINLMRLQKKTVMGQGIIIYINLPILQQQSITSMHLLYVAG